MRRHLLLPGRRVHQDCFVAASSVSKAQVRLYKYPCTRMSPRLEFPSIRGQRPRWPDRSRRSLEGRSPSLQPPSRHPGDRVSLIRRRSSSVPAAPLALRWAVPEVVPIFLWLRSTSHESTTRTVRPVVRSALEGVWRNVREDQGAGGIWQETQEEQGVQKEEEYGGRRAIRRLARSRRERGRGRGV